MKKIITLLFLSASPYLFGQTARQIENIEAFNRLYGYVKYFHPSDEAANLDWNAFAFYGTKEVAMCNSTDALQQTLMTLFQPIAPTLQIIKSSEQKTFSEKILMPDEPSKYKTITWQHVGIGLGNPNSIYKSARLNRKSSPTAQSAFCTITSALNIEQYQNKPFVLTAKVKLSDGPGSGHLWARVDRANATVGFFENMMNNPIVTNAWTEYEIKGTLDRDGVQLAFGCFLKDKGKLFVDELNLSIQSGADWKNIYSNSFETDASNDFPKSISGSNSSGYRTMVTEAESSEGKKSICIEGLKEEEVDLGLLFNRYCHIGEFIKKEIGSGLSILMPLAVYGDEHATYPKGDTGKIVALQNRLKEVPKTTKDLHVRIGDLIITWNIFQHFYPYFKESKTDWNGAFRTAIKEAYNNQSEYDFVKTLRKFTAHLKDGHVSVYAPVVADQEDFFLPLKWEWIEDQLVVTNVLNDTLPIKVGDIVTAIAGQSPKKYFKDLYAEISAATTGWLAHRAELTSVQGPKNSKVPITISTDRGNKNQITIIRNVPPGQYYEALRHKNTDAVKILSEGIYYVDIGVASMESIKAKMSELQQAKAVICDLRGYPNNNHELIGYLLSQKDTSNRWMRVPRIIYPDQENITGYEEMGWSMQPLTPHLKAKMFFIIDGRAISYAESYLSFIEHYKLATIVGQPSAGTNGNVNPFTLPGAIKISWTGMKVFKHDGTQHHGVGILPNVYVTKTIQGVRQQKDEFLDKALELASR